MQATSIKLWFPFKKNIELWTFISVRTKVSLSEGFMESFMTLTIINFTNMTKREKLEFHGM